MKHFVALRHLGWSLEHPKRWDSFTWQRRRQVWVHRQAAGLPLDAVAQELDDVYLAADSDGLWRVWLEPHVDR